MVQIIALAVYCGIGLVIWLGILRLVHFYKQRAPENVQDRIYRVGKNLPATLINLAVSVLFWSEIGVLLLSAVLGIFGAEGMLPIAPWEPLMVILIPIMLLINFWAAPEQVKDKPARGRKLREFLDESPKKPNPQPSAKRGRTIRSYRDL